MTDDKLERIRRIVNGEEKIKRGKTIYIGQFLEDYEVAKKLYDYEIHVLISPVQKKNGKTGFLINTFDNFPIDKEDKMLKNVIATLKAHRKLKKKQRKEKNKSITKN